MGDQAGAQAEIPVGYFGWDPNVRDDAFRDDPAPALNRIRAEAPVHRTPQGVYRVMRHADVTRVLKELRVGMRTTEGVLPGVDETYFRRTFMLLQDPPNHTRLRRIVSRAFTPPAIEALRGHVQALVGGLLDRVQDAGELDVIADLARPVPSTVICQMLDVPLADRDSFTDWTAEVTHLLAPRNMSDEQRDRSLTAGANLYAYMAALIDERRKALGDDMLSVLIRAEEEGDRLSTEELIVQATGLLVAGFETTIGLIGNGVRQLLLHPDELSKLVARPGLIGAAVEECLRYDGPIPATMRVLHEEAEIGGYLIPKDRQLILSIASAHRDPEVFDDPDSFRIEREHSAHLAFGGGIHFCLGAHLARMEARVAIGELFRRMPNLELMRDDILWGKSLFRVQSQLPVRIRG